MEGQNQTGQDQSEPEMPAAGGSPGSEAAASAGGRAGRGRKNLVVMALAGLLIIAVAIGGYFVVASLTKKEEARYTIGLMLPFTKDSSTWGVAAELAVELAKSELGADNITIIKEDTQCDETLAAEGFDRLAARGVIAVIGETCSGASLAALPRANAHKIVLISPSSSSPDLAVPDDYFFRVVPPDTIQGEFAAKMVYEKRGLKKVALICADDAYGKGICDAFGENFTGLGGQIVTRQTFNRDATDLTKQFEAVKAARPDAVYWATNSLATGGAILKHAKSVGLTAPMFTADGVYDRTLISTAGDAAEGLTITSFAVGTDAFRKALRGSSSATGDAAEAYDAFKAIYLAIRQGAKTSEDVRRILPTIEFDGVSTRVKFDANGDVSENYQYNVSQVKNQQFVPVTD